MGGEAGSLLVSEAGSVCWLVPIVKSHFFCFHKWNFPDKLSVPENAPLIFLLIFIYVCECSVWYKSVCAGARGGWRLTSVSLSITFSTLFFWNSKAHWLLDWLAREPWGLSACPWCVPSPHQCWVTDTCDHTWLFARVLGSKFRSSCRHSGHFTDRLPNPCFAFCLFCFKLPLWM